MRICHKNYKTNLDFNLMPLFSIFHLPIFVSKSCFRLIKLPLGDLPESVDLISLKLEVIPLFSLPIQLLSQPCDVLFQLWNKRGMDTHVYSHSIQGTITSFLFSFSASFKKSVHFFKEYRRRAKNIYTF